MTQEHNITIAKKLLTSLAEHKDPHVIGCMFAENLRFEIQGDTGVLPWVGEKTGRQSVIDFFREVPLLTETVKFEVEDIFGSAERAVIVGELATRIKSPGTVFKTQFAIILTISDGLIARYQMLEDSFALSRSVRG